jgi:Methyltransferase domain
MKSSPDLPSIRGYGSGLSDAEAAAVLALAVDTARQGNGLRFLEVGVLKGGTIKFIADHAPGGVYAGVDLFEDFELHPDNTHISPTTPLAEVQKHVGPAVELIKGESTAVLPRLAQHGRTFNFVLIDANHTYGAVKQDFELVLTLLEPGGRVAFHNTSLHIFPDLKYALRDGGPWKLTQELRRNPEYFLEADVERVRVFSRA